MRHLSLSEVQSDVQHAYLVCSLPTGCRLKRGRITAAMVGPYQAYHAAVKDWCSRKQFPNCRVVLLEKHHGNAVHGQPLRMCDHPSPFTLTFYLNTVMYHPNTVLVLISVPVPEGEAEP